jgi:NADH-quinone oxidoreductase subunit E
VPISETTREDAHRLVARNPVARSALLPLLHLVQAEEGYVSEDGIAFCAEMLGLTKAEVGAVSTFYTMYKREPFGDYLLSVCTNPTCKIAGGQQIYESYVDACGGHIDREGGVMVEHAECLGICDAAPVVQVNYEMYGPVTHDEAMELLAKAKAGDPPPSNWSGEQPPTFSEVERQLSGIEDTFGDHLVEAARLQVASDVPPAYRTGETDIPATHPGGDPHGHGGAAFREASGIGVTRADVSPEEHEVLEDVADQESGVAAELAHQLTGDQPTAPAPRSEDHPELPGEEAAPAEVTGDETVDQTDRPAGAADPEEPGEADTAVDADDDREEG